MKIVKVSQNITQGMNPQVSKAIRESLKGSGLTLSKVSPFLETLFSNLGDIPISTVKKVLEGLQQEDIALQQQQNPQQQQVPTNQAQMPPNQGVAPQSAQPQGGQVAPSQGLSPQGM